MIGGRDLSHKKAPIAKLPQLSILSMLVADMSVDLEVDKVADEVAVDVEVDKMADMVLKILKVRGGACDGHGGSGR